MKNTKSLTITAMLIAIGLVLPPLIRMIPNGGVLFSPMHICPLLAGLIVGPIEGIIVGIVCPLLNNVLYGMPMGSTLIGMCFELPTYALVTALMMKVLENQKDTVRVYGSLVVSMIAGRIVGGIVRAIVLGAGNYTVQMWATSYFVSTLPAIIIHLLLIPAVYFALRKANLIKG